MSSTTVEKATTRTTTMPHQRRLRRRKSSLKTSGTSGCSRRECGKRVAFDRLEVQEYAFELGDNPSTFDGPPLTLSWEPQRSRTYDIDYFEAHRQRRRPREELVIKGYIRIILLQRSGFASKDIDNAMREAKQTQQLRAQSIANMRWDLLTSPGTESLGHKLKKRVRLLKKGVPCTSKNSNRSTTTASSSSTGDPRPAASRTRTRTRSNNNQCPIMVVSVATLFATS